MTAVIVGIIVYIIATLLAWGMVAAHRCGESEEDIAEELERDFAEWQEQQKEKKSPA